MGNKEELYKELEEKAISIRRNIVEMVYMASSGHPGGSLSIADILTVLYFLEMNVSPIEPKDENRDRFVLSKGHASPALYATLAERGFIKKEDLRDVVVVVTRYFGGIKLGAGGLVRAYTKGAKVGIEAGIVIEKVKYSEVKIKIEYTQLGRIQNEIMNLGFKVKDTIYSEDVELIVYVRNEEAQSLMDRIIDITSGTADVSLGEEYYLSEKDGELIL